MGIFGEYGSRSGQEALERQKLIVSVATEKDLTKLMKYIAFDQVDLESDPCGKSWFSLNDSMTDLTKAAIRRAYFLLLGTKVE